ncbi:hypothetical protein [Patulibacter minatonensis]|nr:hypothetical protein [Patulibacter minatonensis]
MSAAAELARLFLVGHQEGWYDGDPAWDEVAELARKVLAGEQPPADDET